jgi:hypothetical protein
MEVILRPLKRNAWAGVKNYKNCFDNIGTYFTRSNQFYTGLTKEDAERLEIALQKEPRSLVPSSEFWNTFYVKMGNKDLILNTEFPMDELKYLFLLGHKRVANGYSDNKPTADYVLINKESEAQQSNKFNQLKRKANKEFDKLSTADMKKALRLFGHRSDNLSAELVEAKLFELVDKEPIKFLDKWVENKKRETEYLIQEAVAKNVIRKNRSEYTYGMDNIGHTLEDTISYLDSPEHRDLKAIIINEVNAK